MWWKVVITISSSSDGLRVDVDHVVDSYVQEDKTKVVDLYGAADKLKAGMAEIVDGLKRELKKTFEGQWVYNWFGLDLNTYDFAHPIFTRGGDLVFERVEFGAECLAGFGVHAAQIFHLFGDAALFAQRGDAGLFQLGEIIGGGDKAGQFFF